MDDKSHLVSDAYRAFMTEAPKHAEAWGEMVRSLAEAGELDRKTRDLAYIAVLAALNRTSGIPFHVASAKESGANREEIISAVLVGLPVAGPIVTQSLPSAIAAFEDS